MLFMSIPAPAERSGPDNQILDRCIRQIAGGDREGLATLYQLTRSAIYGFALSILKNVDDAEDITQDTFVQIYRAAEQYRSRQKPMAWMLTIARNLALNRMKDRGRTLPMEAPDLSALDRQSQVTQEDRLVLESLLSLLGEQERQIVTLHALTGLKHREIAQLLGLPLSTVLSKYHRGMKKLQNAWKEVQ